MLCPAAIPAWLVLELCRTSVHLLQRMQVILGAQGLTCSQFQVLRVLCEAGGEGLACGRIAERVVAREPDMTRLLDRMEKAGLIERRRSERDRRVVVASLTARGRELFMQLRGPVLEALEQLLAPLGEGRRDEIVGQLRALRSGEQQG